MIKIMHLAAIVSVCLLTACTVHPPKKTTVTLPNGVQVQTSGTNSNGNFCPPGQAKKGRC